MAYRDRLIEHLCRYKESGLKISEPGIYRHGTRQIECRHILPLTERWQNVLEPIRPAVRAFLEANPTIELHRYFHHLNSSQAFALNLFFPYFEGGPERAGVLLRALGQEGALHEGRWTIEDIPDEDEESNMDVSWTTSKTVRTLCEVKLTESEFGRAPNDKRHLDKLHNVYEPRLRDQVDPALLRPDTFFRNYQILRNIWHLAASDSQRLVLLLPRSNESSWSALEAIVPKVHQNLRNAISIVSVESVLHALRCDETEPAMQEYADALAAKYLIP